MPSYKFLTASLVTLLCCSNLFFAADKKSKETKSAETEKPSYALPQPATETLDLNMYQLIREEGLTNSPVMEYGSGLAEGIGPRVTGSPNPKRANRGRR